MQIGEHDRRVVLEGVEHPIAVVRIDVDVGDALEAGTLELLDGYAAVVEHAEPGCAVARRMVQPGDRHEGAPAVAALMASIALNWPHQRRRPPAYTPLTPACRRHRAGRCRWRSVPARIRDTRGCGRKAQLLVAGGARLERGDALRQAACAKLAHESGEPVGAERVAVTEPVTGEALADHHCDACHGGLSTARGHACAARIKARKPNTAARGVRWRPCAALPASPSTPAPAAIAGEFPYTLRRMAQYIYTMNRVSQGGTAQARTSSRDISLSFFPGAKIGVLGLNGAGKSTLLKIMAGVDTDFDGEARPQPGIRIGYLPQEPQLDPRRTCAGSSMEGVGDDLPASVERFNEISDKFAEPMDDDEMTALLESRRSCRTRSTPSAAGSSSASSRSPPMRCACRRGTRDRHRSRAARSAAWRCAGCCCPKPDMLLLDEPTNHLDAESIAWLERYLEEYPGTVIAVTHDRYFLDNVAEWILELDRGHGIPWQGQLLLVARAEGAAPRRSRSASRRPRARRCERELEWVRQNPKARQAKSKARLQRFEELASQEFQERNETNEIYIPPGAAPRRSGDRGRRTDARATATGC